MKLFAFTNCTVTSKLDFPLHFALLTSGDPQNFSEKQNKTQVAPAAVSASSLASYEKSIINLDVMDSLKLNSHVNRVVKSCFSSSSCG